MSVDERDGSLGDGDAKAGGPPHVPGPADDRGATGRAEEDGVLPPPRELPPSDAELIGRMRSGDDTAYEELFRRHADAVRRYARTCCRDPHTAEDLTAEVFARMLQAVRGGSGPEHAVRAYLLTSVRRVAAGWTQSARREQLVDDFAAFAAQAAGLSEAPEDAVELGADVRAMHQAEQSLAMRAFRSLPERWQAVLWHTEVEDESPSEVATLFGLDAGGARVLASRAREGLKQAYLQAHVSSALTDDEECARYADRLGSYARGRLRTRAERGLRKHLEECARCRLAATQIQEVAGGIPALVPVAVIGWFGTAGYGKAAGLLAGGAAAAGGGASGTAPASPGPAAPVKAGVATGVVAVGVVAAVVLALAGNDTPAEPEPKAAPRPSSPAAQPPEKPPTPAPQPPPTRIPPPTPAPLKPKPTPTTPRPTPTPTPTPTRTPTPTPTAKPTPPPTSTPPPAPTTYAWNELPYDTDGDGTGPEMRLGESGWLWQRHGLSIAGRQYAHGVTVSGSSSVTIDLNRACSAYDALVGVDDLTAKLGKVHFSVHADGTQLWSSGRIKGGDPAVPVHVDLTGYETVRLVVEPHSPVDNAALADWAESKFTCA
ncbi:ECF subfamily RNA polymerase sigma-24 subunit [Streptomyces cyaneogriseus subsp. noncyanogenus]|uniref:ECF subfamily RNA polymerase sigma-24 subunit n=1 Tax=Streptomyces cyaneogriseus subsp. noncyanogenus TaxID=477245 RepID=A0A0C5GF81_9ACTN|nr:sigma-70 family RNA polymerase sigma factor [Streptomyces cyaneogriseus]AJP03016.1 ECF subfamily RNA polymerase sigma-24 subunit [Streptomyces cyaneogriseus subsp. noncyanogenus]